MTLESLVRSGGVTFVVDTNIALSLRRLIKLCGDVARLNEAPWSLGLRVCVPAVVHMEMLHDLRASVRGSGRSFDISKVEDSLRAKGIEVISFDSAQAEQASEWLDSRFPRAEDWREAKRRQCLQQLGLRPDQAPGKRCSATVDWLIASYVCHERYVIVTEDSGPEFCGVERKSGFAELEGLFSALMSA